MKALSKYKGCNFCASRLIYEKFVIQFKKLIIPFKKYIFYLKNEKLQPLQ